MNSNSNATNNGHKYNTSNQTEADSSQSNDAIDFATVQAQQAIEGLEAAGLNYAAMAVSRLANKLDTESDDIAQTIAQLSNPRLLMALSFSKAAAIVDAELGKDLQFSQPRKFPKPKISLPSTPCFGAFYSVPESPSLELPSSAPDRTSPASNSDEISEAQASNGSKPESTPARGFSKQAKA